MTITVIGHRLVPGKRPKKVYAKTHKTAKGAAEAIRGLSADSINLKIRLSEREEFDSLAAVLTTIKEVLTT